MSNVESNIGRKPVSIQQEIAQPVSLQFDPNQYRAELDGLDITDAQKDAFMAVLWDILRRFVEIGFSVDVCSALLANPITIPEQDSLR